MIKAIGYITYIIGSLMLLSIASGFREYLMLILGTMFLIIGDRMTEINKK